MAGEVSILGPEPKRERIDLKPEQPVLSSFDIFDTLLTRRSGGAESIFREVGRRALEEQLFEEEALDPERFLRLRMHAECASRRDSASGETTLQRIYRSLGAWFVLPGPTAERLLLLELEVERTSLIALPGAPQLLKEARRSGGAVAFLSDMYLPAGFLEDLLTREGFYQEGDILLVSGEEECSKRGGGLYRRLCEVSGLEPSRIRHFGNDHEADVRMASRSGLEAHHLADGNFNRYEEAMDRSAPENGGWGAVLAGTSRLTRLHHREAGEMGRIAASVVAPVLVPFVLWLLNSVRTRGISKMVFVSRDGYLLKAITDRIVELTGGKEETLYLYGGRQAFHLPTIKQISEEELRWLLDHNETTTLEQVCQRVGLTCKEASEVLSELGFAEEDWCRPVTSTGVQKLRDHLQGDGSLGVLIRDRAAVHRELILRYFRGTGVLDDGPVGFIDLGWHGNLERSFRVLLGEAGKSDVFGYYFGLRANCPTVVTENASTFLFGGDKPKDDMPFLIQMMETFCTAPHPPVSGFEEKIPGGAVTPIFEEGHEQALKDWGHEKVHEVVLDFTTKFVDAMTTGNQVMGTLGSPPVLQPLVRALLRDFIQNPTREEAEAWGAFPYDTEQVAGRSAPMAKAPKVSIQTMLKAVRIGEATALDPTRGVVYWPSGLEKLTPRVLNACLRIGRLKRKVAGLLSRDGSSGRRVAECQ